MDLAGRGLRLAIALFLMCGPVAFAQESGSGRVLGTVTDQTGGVIVDASVELSGGAAKSWTASTDGQGRYVFGQIPPGSYTVAVDAPGFLKRARPVRVRPNAATVLDIGLEVGVWIAVDVSDRDLEARKNLSSMTLTRREIDALPDDPQMLLRRLLEMAGSSGARGDVAVYVDGFRNPKRLPPKSVIDTIRINSNPFSAEFAQQSARRIEITTKPGSDGFHGDGRVQARSNRLDARHPLADTAPRGEYRNYSGYLQGPILKNRVGFLFYAGQWKQDDNATVHATVLDAGVPQLFATTVSTPTSVTSVDAKLDFRAFNQVFNVSYGRTNERHRNQGLESGFDLPERAYERRSSDDVGRMWWSTLGRRSINDVRLEVTRSVADRTAASSAPAVLVLDAFNSGGNQYAASRSTVTGVQARETLTFAKGRHTLKTGVQLETVASRSADRTDFGGTFTFGADVERDSAGRPVLDAAGRPVSIAPLDAYRRTLGGMPGYGPSQFTIAAGNPAVAVDQWSLGWFLLDDWFVSKRVSLSYGLRQELQNNVAFRANLAPRVALSWLFDPKGKNALKLGAGVFYAPVDEDITLETRKRDGSRRQQIIVPHPSFFPLVPLSFEAAPAVQSAVYIKAEGLRQPASFISSLTYERELPHGLFVSAQYLFGRGINQLRLRPIATAARESAIFQFESSGRMIQHELLLAARAWISASLNFHGNYRLGRKNSDTDTPSTLPADSENLRNEYGAAAVDRRHQFSTGMTIGIPGGIHVAPELTVASGRPFNITTGRDNNGDSIFTDRPSFANPGDAGAVVTAFGVFNPNPLPGATIIPRNFGREPWQVNVNLAVSRTYRGLTVTGDAENLLNAHRFFASNGVLTSPVFGRPNKALNGRRLELTLRYGF